MNVILLTYHHSISSLGLYGQNTEGPGVFKVVCKGQGCLTLMES